MGAFRRAVVMGMFGGVTLVVCGGMGWVEGKPMGEESL